jgi:Flp pilus assembly protein TadB
MLRNAPKPKPKNTTYSTGTVRALLAIAIICLCFMRVVADLAFGPPHVPLLAMAIASGLFLLRFLRLRLDQGRKLFLQCCRSPGA